MIDLFRYIEQSFIVPPKNLNAIDVSDSSDFQNKLRIDLQQEENVPLQLRKDAGDFIENYSNKSENPFNLGQQYLDFHVQLLGLTSVSADDIDGTIEKIFDCSSSDLVSSPAFKNDRQFLNDLIIAVKMVTGFDKVRANDLVAMRQAIAFIEATTGSNCQTSSVEDVKATLLRPIVVPSAFLKTPSLQPPPEPLPSGDSDEVKKLKDEIKTIKPEDIVKGLKEKGKSSKQGKPPQERDLDDLPQNPAAGSEEDDESDEEDRPA